jgi:ecotin
MRQKRSTASFFLRLARAGNRRGERRNKFVHSFSLPNAKTTRATTTSGSWESNGLGFVQPVGFGDGLMSIEPMKAILSTALLATVSLAIAQTTDNMRAFPPAEKGMTRHVIRLPQERDEAALKVEVIVGKTVRTDAQNRYFFGGNLETENIPGWGYDRYILRKLGPMAGTRMAPDPNAPQVDRFISLGGEAILRYNSRLPIVVYVPDGVEVKYRLWRAEPTLVSPAEAR